MLEKETDPELIEEAKRRTKWLTYKEKQIFFQDYTNLEGNEIARLIPAFTQLELDIVKEGSIQLLDFSSSFANKDALNTLGEAAKMTKHLYKKTAVLGITGLKKILLNALNRITSIGAKAFASEDEAKEWLIS